MRVAKFIAATVFMSASLMTLSAQTAVTTTGGTSGTVPVFTGSATVGNSVITQSNGNVGVGTTNPQTNLHIGAATGGGIRIGAIGDLANYKVSLGALTAQFNIDFSGARDVSPDQIGARIAAQRFNVYQENNGLVQSTGLAFYTNPSGMNTGGADLVESMFIAPGGNIGIRTTAPGALLNIGSLSNSTQAYGSTPALFVSNPTEHTVPTAEIKFSSADPGCAGCWNIAEKVTVAHSSGTGNTNYGLWIDSNSAATNYAIYANSGMGYFAGNVGIGTAAPGAKLEVNGGIRLTSGSGGGIVFADGSVQTVAYPGPVSCGGDYAESVDVTGARNAYEPGDVIVIDPINVGKFLKSSDAYSSAVAGIFSTKPGYVGRRQTEPKSADEVPMAMIGIVPVKVSTENGPIHPRDLLVTSSTPGYAMKGTDREKMLGAVIGKAMGTLESGTGVIEVLVTLQ